MVNLRLNTLALCSSLTRWSVLFCQCVYLLVSSLF
jgi:hypothetical protein